MPINSSRKTSGEKKVDFVLLKMFFPLFSVLMDTFKPSDMDSMYQIHSPITEHIVIAVFLLNSDKKMKPLVKITM